MDIEALAVSAVQSVVALCPRLQPFIALGDKVPFTDGHIEMYRNESKKKDDWMGRVLVQVKGRKAPSNPKKRKSFSINRTELLAYQQERGVLYFVVFVKSNGETAPYHALLTPFAIDALLSKASTKQANISVPLKPLPTRAAEFEQIVLVALKGKNQNPLLGFTPIAPSDARRISITTVGGVDWSAPVKLIPGENDFVLEMATSSGALVAMPGEFSVFPADYVAHEIEVFLRAGEVSYDRATVRRIDSETFEVKLIGGVALVLASGDEKRFKIDITPHSNFAERHRAISFVIALIDNHRLEINGNLVDLTSVPDDEYPAQEIAEIRAHLALLRNLHELFVLMSVDGALIDLGEISDEQGRMLRMLYDVFVKGAQMIKYDGQTGWSVINVGRWKLMVVALPGDAPNHWRLVDPFDSEAPQSFRGHREPPEQGFDILTAYDIIDKDNLPTILNLRLESAVPAYDAIADFERVVSRANYFVLDLITAADECPERKQEFLRGAKQLNEWVITKNGSGPTHLVNRWQIEYRDDMLTAQDRYEIRQLKHTVSATSEELAEEVELACAILLGEVEEADYLAGQMQPERLQRMEAWPIWRLRDHHQGIIAN
ncbi:hypothetical protein GCM10028784_29510 [Myceligenerans cantabricum]